MLRTYLSMFLLLCLVIQIAPLSLVHSHEDHSGEVGHFIAQLDPSDVHDGENVSDEHHESEEDCNICEIQQSLNNQAYTFGKQMSVLTAVNQTTIWLGVSASVDDYLLKNTPGRAPPLG